jgi:hypothetical protein
MVGDVVDKSWSFFAGCWWWSERLGGNDTCRPKRASRACVIGLGRDSRPHVFRQIPRYVLCRPTKYLAYFPRYLHTMKLLRAYLGAYLRRFKRSHVCRYRRCFKAQIYKMLRHSRHGRPRRFDSPKSYS